MYGSLVSSRTAMTSADSVVSINHHTVAVFVANLDKTNDATIKLNNIYEVLVPHSPNGAGATYVKIPGDYTKIECLTANVTIAFYAVG